MLLRKARLHAGLILVRIGVWVAGTHFPEQGAEEFEGADDPNPGLGVTFQAAVIGPTGQEMLRQGKRPRRRVQEPPPPALLGSARDQREKAELARRGVR
jgi:hypothetical protein